MGLLNNYQARSLSPTHKRIVIHHSCAAGRAFTVTIIRDKVRITVIRVILMVRLH